MRRCAALAFAALALLVAACEAGEVPRDQFDAVVEERNDATRQLGDVLVANDELRRQLDTQAESLLAEADATTEEQNRFWEEWLRTYDEAFSSLDPDQIGQLFAEDAVYEQASSGLILRGRNSILVEFVTYWEGFTVFRTTSERFFASENEIVFLWAGNATRTDGSFELVSGGTYVELDANLDIIRQVDYAEFP